VDGGVNRYVKFITDNSLNQHVKPPDVVCGDFDSCTQESLDLAKTLGAQVLYNKNMFLKPNFSKFFLLI
jgi:thiamine pyrophosphokinase